MSELPLVSVNIGKWVTYQAYRSKEQIALQRNNLTPTGLENKSGEINFIFTEDIERLNDYVMKLASKVSIEATETIIEDEVYFTTKIEGAKTTRKRTQEIHNGSMISKDNEYSERMVKNCFGAVKILNLYSDNINVNKIIEVWKILVDGVCDNEDIIGNTEYPFRSGDVGIGSYTGADYTDVEKLMTIWVTQFNNDELSEYPFIKAILLHYAFETIHPFCDGNGRMGRLLMNHYLICNGVESACAVSFSMSIDKNRPKYDAAFVDSENLYNDATPFVEYMLEVCIDAYESALCIQTS